MNFTGIVFMTLCKCFFLAVEAPNEVHLPLETHSEVDGGGMCMNDLTIYIPQLILSHYIHNVIQSLELQHRSMSMTCINN